MMSAADEFARIMAENFREVRYDPEKRRGTVLVPTIGVVDFRESANDPAVILDLSHTKRFKGGAETAVEFLDRLREAWGNSE